MTTSFYNKMRKASFYNKMITKLNFLTEDHINIFPLHNTEIPTTALKPEEEYHIKFPKESSSNFASKY